MRRAPSRCSIGLSNKIRAFPTRICFSEFRTSTAAVTFPPRIIWRKVIERDPYSSEAYYYLAMSQFALKRDRQAERNLYFIWPDSAYYGEREYWLGRLALLKKDHEAPSRTFKAGHRVERERSLAQAGAGGCAIANKARDAGSLGELAEVERIDPTSRLAAAERYFLTGDPAAKAELVRLLGGQSQEARGIHVLSPAGDDGTTRHGSCELVERKQSRPLGHAARVLLHARLVRAPQRRLHGRRRVLKKARAAAGNIDRFPYREDSEAPLAEAVSIDPNDAVARFALGCLLYFRASQPGGDPPMGGGCAGKSRRVFVSPGLGTGLCGARRPVSTKRPRNWSARWN